MTQDKVVSEDNFDGIKIPKGDELGPDELDYGGGFRKKTPEEFKKEFSVGDDVYILYNKMEFILHFFYIDLLGKSMPERLLYMDVLENMTLEIDRLGIKKVQYKGRVVFIRGEVLERESLEEDINKVQRQNREDRRKVYQIVHKKEGETKEKVSEELKVVENLLMEYNAKKELEGDPLMLVLNSGAKAVAIVGRLGVNVVYSIVNYFKGDEFRKNIETGKELAIFAKDKVPVYVDSGFYLTNVLLNTTGTGDVFDDLADSITYVPEEVIKFGVKSINTILDYTQVGEGVDEFFNVTSSDAIGLASLTFKRYVYGMSDKDILDKITPRETPKETETLFSEDIIRKEGENVIKNVSSLGKDIKDTTTRLAHYTILVLTLLIVYQIVK